MRTWRQSLQQCSCRSRHAQVSPTHAAIMLNADSMTAIEICINQEYLATVRTYTCCLGAMLGRKRMQLDDNYYGRKRPLIVDVMIWEALQLIRDLTALRGMLGKRFPHATVLMWTCAMTGGPPWTSKDLLVLRNYSVQLGWQCLGQTDCDFWGFLNNRGTMPQRSLGTHQGSRYTCARPAQLQSWSAWGSTIEDNCIYQDHPIWISWNLSMLDTQRDRTTEDRIANS